MKIALTIAGSDPTGGAGLQADLKTFHALGVYGISIPSALTAQNTEGVYDIHEIPDKFFSSQLDTLLKDVRPDALKTGMLFTSKNVKIVADTIKEYSLDNLVTDPVLVSSSGVTLAADDITQSIQKYLLPIAKVVTPNLDEASALTGISIKNESDMRDAAVQINDMGTGAVIITGGHFSDIALDLLYDGNEFTILEKRMLEGEFHGTGCVFSSVITACLALQHSLKDAFIKAKAIVYQAMTSAHSITRGMKLLKI